MCNNSDCIISYNHLFLNHYLHSKGALKRRRLSSIYLAGDI
nr:MAG TPA: hypothetical protein [Caudoviricetes sp.]